MILRVPYARHVYFFTPFSLRQQILMIQIIVMFCCEQKSLDTKYAIMYIIYKTRKSTQKSIIMKMKFVTSLLTFFRNSFLATFSLL